MIKIQKLVRGHLSRKHTKKVREFTEAAVLKLQRGFRGMTARENRSRMLWERDMELRRHEISTLASEHEFQVKVVQKLRKKARRKQWDEKYV